MRRFFLGGVMALSGLAWFALAVPARAVVVAPPPLGPERLAKVDAIVVGRIIALEGKDLQAPASAKAQEKTTYRIAVLAVTEGIKGARSQQTIRLGFFPPPSANAGGVVRRPPIRRFSPVYEVGQDGMFFLTKHFQETFYLTPMYYDFLSAQNGNFAQEVKQVKLTLKLGNNLAQGLKSKDAEERFLAAALLIQKYRTPLAGRVPKTEPIDAQESKLILKALLEADWKNNRGPFSPWVLFLRLGLSNKDGWTFPRGTQEERLAAAQAWLREHQASYRIQRLRT